MRSIWEKRPTYEGDKADEIGSNEFHSKNREGVPEFFESLETEKGEKCECEQYDAEIEHDEEGMAEEGLLIEVDRNHERPKSADRTSSTISKLQEDYLHVDTEPVSLLFALFRTLQLLQTTREFLIVSARLRWSWLLIHFYFNQYLSLRQKSKKNLKNNEK